MRTRRGRGGGGRCPAWPPPLPGRYQEAPDPHAGDAAGDADGNASVTIEIGLRTTVNHVAFNSSGVTETAAAADGAASDVATRQAATTSSDIGLAELAIARALESPDTSLTVTNDVLEDRALSAIVQPPPAADPVADGIAVEGVAAGGQTGATVQVGDTMGGAGETGAPGGDATVVVRTGPVSGGQAVAGEATGGDGIALIAGDGAGGAATPSVPAAGIAWLGSLLVLEAAPTSETDPGTAGGGAAIGGSARGGDATVDITIGDTIGGAGANGRPGGDAEVIIEIGPITGGDATGAAATGGDAIDLTVDD
ncbi:MAG: hypothetical protein M3464_05745 [Chloroflexota bacterium]|nr:hypothetical protein [Chloroflexota bacterium]